MESKPTASGRTFITPLRSPDIFDPGQTFPRDELLRRVLSVFWRNCCGVPGLARAPAPVIERTASTERSRAWWVMYDGIIEENEGPNSERIALFFGREGQTAQLWPRFEFEVREEPFAVDMSFHQDRGLGWVLRIRLELLPGGSVQVVGEEAR
jgi:hypothetical protein